MPKARVTTLFGLDVDDAEYYVDVLWSYVRTRLNKIVHGFAYACVYGVSEQQLTRPDVLFFREVRCFADFIAFTERTLFPVRRAAATNC